MNAVGWEFIVETCKKRKKGDSHEETLMLGEKVEMYEQLCN